MRMRRLTWSNRLTVMTKHFSARASFYLEDSFYYKIKRVLTIFFKTIFLIAYFDVK